MELQPKFREILLESTRLAGEWYANNQNSEKHPWGGVHDSADVGRFLYEYYPATHWCRGAGVWAQAVGIMGLLTLSRRLKLDDYKVYAKLAAGYLKSLQVINPSDERNHGALRERTPQCEWSFPRDAATGGMGFVALYRETKEEDYLNRAKLFAEWYHRFGSNEQGWPYGYFDIAKGDGSNLQYVLGDWQAGGGLLYYWLYKVTGEEKWLEYLRQLIDPLIEMYERNADAKVVPGFHGEVEISYGNDDFAIVTLIAAYRQWGEKRMLNALTHHIKRLWTLADEDGSYPSVEGTYVCTINNMEYLELCREKKLTEDMKALEKLVMKTAKFSLTQQVTDAADIRSYGGFYGETNYGVSRDRISHRSTGYAMLMNLRVVGGTETPYYSSYGW